MPQGDNPIEIAAYAKGRSFPTTIDEKRALAWFDRAGSFWSTICFGRGGCFRPKPSKIMRSFGSTKTGELISGWSECFYRFGMESEFTG